VTAAVITPFSSSIHLNTYCFFLLHPWSLACQLVMSHGDQEDLFMIASFAAFVSVRREKKK
jgi:hypothetical protein